jgi:UDP-glucose 4-epimerase
MPLPEPAAAFRGKRVLITGGLGFLGSSLARALVDAGSDVTLVDSLVPEYGGNLHNIAGIEDRVRINISDIRDRYSLPYLVGDKDILFNFAGQTSHLDSMDDPYTDLEVNCRGQLAVLEASRHHNPAVRVVFASTRQIYGRPEYLPVDERHPLAPVDVNGINKTSGEWYHLLYGDVYGMPVSALRLTNTYGPRMRLRDARQTFLGYWFAQLLTGRELEIFGDGKQRRDFNYVDDVVRAFLLVASSDAAVGKVYNLGHDEVVDLHELAKLLISVNGAGAYRFVPFPDDRKAIDIGDYFGDFSKIRDELGWEPQVRLAEGVRSTLEYYRDHAAAYVADTP